VLSFIATPSEQKISAAFLAGGEDSRVGSNPISIEKMRVLARYPALYDESAVFLGNFDFLVRRAYSERCHYIQVWNEAIQERMFPPASISNINRLFVSFLPKNAGETTEIRNGIKALIAQADSLYDNRVVFRTSVPTQVGLTVNGRLSPIHNSEQVTEQIKSALLAEYGSGNASVSMWLPDGINLGDATKLIQDSVLAFSDNISYFSIGATSSTIYTPEKHVFLTENSINVALTRTADAGGSRWIV
jgi:hypothetical protein